MSQPHFFNLFEFFSGLIRLRFPEPVRRGKEEQDSCFLFSEEYLVCLLVLSDEPVLELDRSPYLLLAELYLASQQKVLLVVLSQAQLDD